MAKQNPYGTFSGPKSTVVLAGSRDPVLASARNFGRTKKGEVQVSGTGLSLGRHQTTSRVAGNTLGRKRGEPLYDERTGEFNASSNKELIEKFAMLINGAQSESKTGRQRLFERAPTEEFTQAMEARSELMREAAAGGMQSPAFVVMGEVLGDEVYETLGREGFGRNCYMVRDLADKEVGRVRVRKKDVTAHVSTTNIMETRVMVRQHWVYPGEYYITSFTSMEEREIAQAGSELLDDKYQDMLEQVMVAEDNYIRDEWNDTVGIYNPELVFNTFTPLFFSQGKINIDHWGIPCTRAVMAWDLWNDIEAEAEFSSWFDPVTKHELVLEGKIGSLMGVQLITDAFRYDTLRVLEDGEIFFLGSQITLGTITQRRPLQTEPTNRYQFGSPERGWFAFQIQGTVTFPRAVAKASRVSS